MIYKSGSATHNFPKTNKKQTKQQKQTKLLNATLASESLQKLSLKSKNGKTKISEIMEDFHENGILLAMVFVWMRGLEGYKWLL